MKKMLVFMLMLALSCAAACAEEGMRLPQAVLDLCAKAHPGYEIAAYDGWGDEGRGQFALILKQGDDNILCIAEKAQQDAAYQLTVDNTHAVYDGDVLPGLLIDSGGDALFYTYHGINGHAAEQYHTDKDTGSWSRVDASVYLQEGDLYHTMLSFVADGELRYQHYDEDENGNILRAWDDVSIAVDEAFEKSLLPQHFNINAFDPDPTDGLPERLLQQGLVRERSDEALVWVQTAQQAASSYPDSRLVSSVQERDYLGLVMQQADGRQFIVCSV